MSKNASLRSLILGATPVFKTSTVTDKESGEVFEVRQPSIRERAEIRKAATTTNDDGTISFEPFDFMLRAAIHCTYAPGGTERVFTPEDYEVLLQQPAGGLIDELSQEAATLCNIEAKDSKKPSSGTKSDS